MPADPEPSAATRSAVDPAGPDPQHGRRPGGGTLGFRLIGAMKIGSALLLALAGFGIFRMINRDLGEVVEHYVKRLHLDPDNRLVHEFMARVAGLTHARLKLIGAGTFFYAILHLVEGTGLILVKRWAEYLTIIATGSLLPLEIYELAHKFTALRVAVFVINLGVLVYVVMKIRQERAEGRI